MDSIKRIWVWAVVATLIVVLGFYYSKSRQEAVVDSEMPVVIEEETIVIAPADAPADAAAVQGSAEPLPDEATSQSQEVFESAIVSDDAAPSEEEMSKEMDKEAESSEASQ